ncbi:hypothetical protein [Chloroflexus sp.]|uniref:hypothetical protein n=1 Tax=Chloroflexus sp. TaxID=1904827 RepID=UPI00261D3929|nr:hypothetical protein [uncultured Chloroflexus sp.]
MSSSVLYQPRPAIDRPTGSAAIARQRLYQTLQRERVLLRERNADQLLLIALLHSNESGPSCEE